MQRTKNERRTEKKQQQKQQKHRHVSAEKLACPKSSERYSGSFELLLFRIKPKRWKGTTPVVKLWRNQAY